MNARRVSGEWNFPPSGSARLQEKIDSGPSSTDPQQPVEKLLSSSPRPYAIEIYGFRLSPE
jgi:hypothetical protein